MKGFEISNKSGKGVIRITGAISWWKNSGEQFTNLVDSLLAQGIEDVDGYINTPGGSMFEANEIGNQILRFPGKKQVKLGALCASAGTVIATYFDEVEAASNLQFMIHDPISQPVIQHEEDYDTDKQLYLNLRNNAIDRYHKKTGIPKEELSSMMKKTTWMNAETSLKKKFIDKISKEKDSLPEDTKNVFEQYNYTNVPDVVNIQFSTITEQYMSKVALHVGLKADATDQEIINAIDSKIALAQGQGSEKGVKALVAMGVEKGFKKELIEKLAKADFDITLQMVQEASAPESNPAPNSEENTDGGRLSNIINQAKKELKGSNANNGGADHPRASWSLRKWETEDPAGLQNMLNKEPDKYINLFESQYGYAPSRKELDELKNL